MPDSLTGLLSYGECRAALDDLLGQESDVGILFIDVDYMKRLNNTLGHQRGDWVLCEIATRVQGVVPARAVVARWGGDKFIVAIDRLALSHLRELAGEIKDVISSRPILSADQDYAVSDEELELSRDQCRWFGPTEHGAYVVGFSKVQPPPYPMVLDPRDLRGTVVSGAYASVSVGVAQTGERCTTFAELLDSAEGEVTAAKQENLALGGWRVFGEPEAPAG